MIRAGRPARACSISRSIRLSSRSRSVTGATSSSRSPAAGIAGEGVEYFGHFVEDAWFDGEEAESV